MLLVDRLHPCHSVLTMTGAFSRDSMERPSIFSRETIASQSLRVRDTRYPIGLAPERSCCFNCRRMVRQQLEGMRMEPSRVGAQHHMLRHLRRMQHPCQTATQLRRPAPPATTDTRMEAALEMLEVRRWRSTGCWVSTCWTSGWCCVCATPSLWRMARRESCLCTRYLTLVSQSCHRLPCLFCEWIWIWGQ